LARAQFGGGTEVSDHRGSARAECTVCGTHATAVPGVRLATRCGNCGSFELRSIDERGPAGHPSGAAPKPRRPEGGETGGEDRGIRVA
jgi:hypothetical protein